MLSGLVVVALNVAVMPAMPGHARSLISVGLHALVPGLLIALAQTHLLRGVTAGRRSGFLPTLLGWTSGAAAQWAFAALLFFAGGVIGLIVAAFACGVVLGLVSGRAFRVMPPLTAPRPPP